MKFGFVGAIAIAWMWCGGALAAELNDAAIAGFCTAQGGFGQQFGAETAVGATGPVILNSQQVAVPSALTPFSQAEVVFTHRSRRLHTVTATASFASEAEASAALQTIGEALSADTRFATSDTTDAEWSLAFYSTDPDSASGFKAELNLMGRELDLSCTDQALFQRTMDEYTGRDITAATPAPTAPQLNLPSLDLAGVCENPERRTALIADFPNRMDQVMAYGAEASRYNEALMQWKSRQLITRGVWTEADSQAFAMRLLSDPQFSRRGADSMTSLMTMSAAAQAFETASNDASRCASAVQTLTAAHQMVARTQAQWDYMSALYDAEAAR